MNVKRAHFYGTRRNPNLLRRRSYWLGLIVLVPLLFLSVTGVVLAARGNPAKASEESSWHTMASTSEKDLWGICAISPTEVFAVGSDSTVLKYDGTNWIDMEPNTNCQLRGVWGSSGNDVFAVGKKSPWVVDDDGIIIHFNGTSWESVDVGAIGSLFDVWGTDSSDIFAIGEEGTILHYDGTNWSKIENINAALHFHSIWGTSASDVFAVGVSYTPGVTNILHYNGTAWEPMESGTTNGLFGVWGSSSSDVYAVGGQDTILHYDGDSWQPVSMGTNTNYNGIWGRSSSDVYAVGQNGIVHFDGGTWTLISGSGGVFHDIQGTSTEIFSVGNLGQTVYYGPKQLPAIWAKPVRQWFDRDSVTDFDAAVGGSVMHYAFSVFCDPLAVADTLDITVTHVNNAFSVDYAPASLQAGTWSYFRFAFSPTQSGFTTDTVVVDSAIGSISFELVGNGVPVISPEFWIADLPVGTKAERILYDSSRSCVYITDSNNNCVLVFSPAEQEILATIPVGEMPIDLAMTPSGDYLYVANSGEPTISEIDLDTATETRRFVLPWLGYDGTTPYSISMVSNTEAFVGGDPPGLASGGPIFQLDFENLILTARDDIGSGARPEFRTSDDLATTMILVEPGASPSKFVRYDNTADEFVSSSYNNIECDVAISPDGSRAIGTKCDNNVYRSEIRLFDRDLMNIKRINSLGKGVSPTFHPEGNYIYTMNQVPSSIQEMNLTTMVQTRDLRCSLPEGYYSLSNPKGSVVSSDGQWLYVLLGQTWNEPPSKLLAVKIDRPCVPPTPPTVMTIDTGNVTATSATLNGNLAVLGTATSVAVSFEYATTAGGPYTSLPAGDMTAPGDFSADVSGLTPNTMYYFRAVAVGAGTDYGDEKTFTTGTVPPEATTNDATNVTASSATLKGDLTSLGSAASVTVSFEYATAAGGPYTALAAGTKDGMGTFSADLNGLTAGTLYYFRAVATGAGTAYGGEKSFTAGTTPPAVTTGDATYVTSSTARLNGTLTSLGDAAGVNVSFEYGTASGTYTTETETQVMSAPGDFSFNLSGLTPGTLYYFRAKAAGAGADYGDEKTFTPSTAPPEATTNDATNITATTVRLNGDLTSLGSATSVTVSFQYATVAGGPYTALAAGTKDDLGIFSVDLSGLTAGTLYYFRAKAAGAGTAYGEEKTFTTGTTADETAPSTPQVTDNGESTTSTTEIHASWSSADAESGIVEYLYAVGTAAGGNDIVDWTSAGSATEKTITGLSLTPGQTYYISVKAVNGQGLTSEVGSSDGIALSADDGEPGGKGGTPFWVWILVALGAAGLGGTFFFLWKWRKKAEPT
jgi:DNA-binding beta-propeller fold protein YncE